MRDERGTSHVADEHISRFQHVKIFGDVILWHGEASGVSISYNRHLVALLGELDRRGEANNTRPNHGNSGRLHIYTNQVIPISNWAGLKASMYCSEKGDEPTREKSSDQVEPAQSSTHFFHPGLPIL